MQVPKPYILALLFSVIIIICNAQQQDDNDLVLKTRLGYVRGSIVTIDDQRQFASFTGLPYAKAPIGNLRFQPPVAIEAWTDIKNATSPAPICVQVNMLNPDAVSTGDDDCLYLNVYTPKIEAVSTRHHYPVMVFIHGGAFQTGSGNDYQPNYLLKHNIVLVTINYRLGVFGFLTTNSARARGNYAMKDQHMAIKWVRDHIHAFGGNAKRITLFGQSAGAGSVHLQVLSHLNKGLLHAAIMESGSALCKWSYDEKPTAVAMAKQVAGYVNCTTDDDEAMTDCLLGKPNNDLITAQQQLKKWDIDPIVTFKPVIEDDVNDPTAFLVEHPAHIIKKRPEANITLLFGLNTDEGVFRVAGIDESNLWSELDANPKEIFSIMTPLPNIDEQIRFYFNNTRISAQRRNLIDYFTDINFAVGVYHAINLHRTYTNQTIYNYLLGYRGSESYTTLFGAPIPGVCHCDDLLYLFPYPPFLLGRSPDNLDIDMTETWTSLWANFATFRNPTPNQNLLNLTWLPIYSDANEYLSVESPTEYHMDANLWLPRYIFWRNLLGSIY